MSLFQWPPSSSASANASVGLNGDPIPSDSTLIGGENSTGDLQPVSVDDSGNVNVNVINSELPAGAATEAKQDDQIALETSINGNVLITGQNTGKLADTTHIVGNPGTAPKFLLIGGTDGVDSYPLAADGSGNLKVSVQDSALPMGAATLAEQQTQTTVLNQIETDLVTVNSTIEQVDLDVQNFAAKSASALVSDAFDEQVINYVGATDKIDTIEYKAAGSTQATLTFSYDGSDRLTGIVKS